MKIATLKIVMQVGFLQQIQQKINALLAYESKQINSLADPSFIFLSIISFLIIVFAYSNHFENAFHFDDSHTIESNQAIRTFTPLRFFTDGTTFSNLPTNQSYRPLITTVNSLDYVLGNGLATSKMFHIHIFTSFILCIILVFIFVKKLIETTKISEYSQFWALIVASFFGALCANAETVNYIIQRAEIVAGVFVVAGLAAYLQGGFWKQKHLYLLFPLIGFFAKEMAFVFAPLLFLYILLFEENTDLLNFYKQSEVKKIINAIFKVLPAFALTITFYVFYTIMTPKTFTPGGFDKFRYFITQPYCMLHYATNYFFPFWLSADTDLEPFESILEWRSIVGFIFVGVTIYFALKNSTHRVLKFVSFGILWYYIALLPTSSFIAFAEVMNDHRPFIPYIGFTIAFVFLIYYAIEKYKQTFFSNSMIQLSFLLLIAFFTLANAYGVYQRNNVWKTEENLWYDVSIKSPKNGRGLMNYGLTLMGRGDYVGAEKQFLKAVEFTPTYSHLYTNLGILYSATNRPELAEDNFKKSIQYKANYNLNAGYFYADFLIKQKRADEAIPLLKDVLNSLPNHEPSKILLAKAETEGLGTFEEKFNKQLANIQKEPTAAKYIDLSLFCYNNAQYEKSIAMAQECLKLDPTSYLAYNNICSGYNQLKQYEKAIKACENGLKINSNFALLKGNLNWAKTQSQQK